MRSVSVRGALTKDQLRSSFPIDRSLIGPAILQTARVYGRSISIHSNLLSQLLLARLSSTNLRGFPLQNFHSSDLHRRSQQKCDKCAAL
eukprot:jgi/Botrbrau1/18824/Bobra.0841s0004.1